MPSQVPEIFSPFAQALAIEMREQRIGGEQLARKTGISVRLIRKYKSGQTVPRDYYGEPSENARKIADALGVSLDVMFGVKTEQAA